MVIENPILKEVKNHVLEVLSTRLPDDMVYHSVHHTEDVVRSANEIALRQMLGEEEVEILNIAAWFHDIGYVESAENHEQKGAEMAREYLVKKGYPEEKITRVENCILATRIPQNPSENIEKILCDADLMHLADDDYMNKADLLLKEIEKVKLCKITEDEWLEMNQEFLDNHCFFTEYAKSHYESAVKNNLKKVRERLKSWKKAKK